MSGKNELIRNISKRSDQKGVEAQQIQNKLDCKPIFPPKTRDGIILVDLSCFSENVVKVLIDMMYGAKEGDIVNLDVEELVRLTNFLQADYDINLV